MLQYPGLLPKSNISKQKFAACSLHLLRRNTRTFRVSADSWDRGDAVFIFDYVATTVLSLAHLEEGVASGMARAIKMG